MDDHAERMTSEALLAQANWVRRLAASLVASDDADDFAQETLRSALAEPPIVASTASLRAWLRSVMRNLVRVDRRGRSARAWHEERAAKREAIESDAGERTELQERLARAVHALAEPYRSAIVLRYFDELAQREIAERQNISYDAARQRLSRGLAMLRAELDRDYDGGRDAWSAVCIAVAKKSSLASAPTALATGGAIVSAKSLIGVAALVAIAATSFWWLERSTSTVELEAGSHAAEPTLAALPKRDEPSSKTNDASQSPTERAPVLAAADDSKQFRRAIDRDRDLHGVVLDPDGKPVAGAELEVTRNEFSESHSLDLANRYALSSIAKARSDEKGEFVFPLPPGRAFDLSVTAAKFAPAVVEHCHAGEHVVVRLELGASLFGRVTREVDGSPVSRASVELPIVSRRDIGKSRPWLTTITDADGRYRFDGLTAGTYTLQVFPKSDADSEWIEVRIAAGETLTQDVAVPSGVTLKGRVFDAANGDPIAGAEVSEGWTFHRIVTTDARGEFVFEGFSLSGYYDVAVRARGYGRVDQPVRAPDDPMPASIDVRLTRARGAKGRVIDVRGKPLENVYVGAVAYTAGDDPRTDQIDWPSVRTLADGTFVLDQLRVDVAHTLELQRDGYAMVSYRLPEREASEPMLDLGDFVLREGAIVRGRVVDEKHQPLADQTISLDGWNADHFKWREGDDGGAALYLKQRTTRTDDLGRFAFADVAPGEYMARAGHEDSHDSVHVAIAVHDGAKPADVELVLARGLSISGRVVGPHGEPVAANVSLDPLHARLGMPSGDVHTDADGAFECSGLAAVDYEVTVYPRTSWESDPTAPHFAAAVKKPIAAGTRDLVIHVANAERLAGRVVDAAGKPAAGVFVSIKRSGAPDSNEAVRTNAAGRFEYWVESGGRFDLRVVMPPPEDAPDSAVGERPTVQLENVAPGGAEIELRLP